MTASVSRYEYETKRNSNAIKSAITEFDFVFVSEFFLRRFFCWRCNGYFSIAIFRNEISFTALLVEENISITIDYFLFCVFILVDATSVFSNYIFCLLFRCVLVIYNKVILPINTKG